MPMLDGIETIRQITALEPGQRVIVLTDYPGEERSLHSIQAGAQGCLLKDCHPDELVAAIVNV